MRMTEPQVLLASASPRRSELLRQVAITHAVRPVDIDESVREGEAPSAYVLRLAESKAAALWQRLAAAERRPVLAADTTVALEGEIFGKPGNRDEAIAMLARLSGRTHQVHTAVAILHAGGAATAKGMQLHVRFQRKEPRRLAPGIGMRLAHEPVTHHSDAQSFGHK